MAYSSGGLIRGGLIKLCDIFRMKSSLSKLLFSIIVKEQSKLKHWFLSKSSSSLLGGSFFDGGGPIRGFTVCPLTTTSRSPECAISLFRLTFSFDQRGQDMPLVCIK